MPPDPLEPLPKRRRGSTLLAPRVAATPGGAAIGGGAAFACRSSSMCMHGCNGHGTCVDRLGACVCDQGWRGEWCQFAACAPPCGAHGWCDALGTCQCDAGWAGADCAARACLHDCSGHGVCVQPEPGTALLLGTCRCHDGWCGPDCSAATPLGGAALPPPPPFALPTAQSALGTAAR